MKVAYDPKTDTLTVTLKEHVAIAESDEDKEGVILDYDDGGDLRRESPTHQRLSSSRRIGL